MVILKVSGRLTVIVIVSVSDSDSDSDIDSARGGASATQQGESQRQVDSRCEPSSDLCACWPCLALQLPCRPHRPALALEA